MPIIPKIAINTKNGAIYLIFSPPDSIIIVYLKREDIIFYIKVIEIIISYFLQK